MKRLIVNMLLMLLLLAFAVGTAHAQQPNMRGTKSITITLEIDQPNVEDCYTSNVPFDDMQQVQFAIYPNPNHGIFVMELYGLKNGEAAQITIFNRNGQSVYTDNLLIVGDPFKTELSLKELPEGMYFIRVQVGNHKATRKVIIL